MMGSAGMTAVAAREVLQKYMDGQEVQTPDLEEACTISRTTIPEVVRCKAALRGVTKPRCKILVLFPANGLRRRF